MADRAGEHVVYVLAEHDVQAIESSRKERTPKVHNNSVEAGQRFPAFIVRDWGGCVNLRVLLDGHDDYWATSRSEGSELGQWQVAGLLDTAEEITGQWTTESGVEFEPKAH
jgi:hypothetical protein